jgi:hypothetical protein
MKKGLVQWLPLVAAVVLPQAFGAVTGMPWEDGLGTVGDSFTKFVAPTIACVGGGLAMVDLIRHHGGGMGTMGQTGLFAAIGGIGGTLWPTAMATLGVKAACI